jgi:hypothetical protein
MKTIETKVYTFDELKPEAKEKAREWYKELDTYDFLEEYMQELLLDLLAQNKIKCDSPKVMYSLSYCQGDGAMFEGVCEWGKYTATIKQSGHYYHYNSKDIEIVKTDTDEYAGDKIADAFEAEYVKICKELEKQGYNYIEAERSDENVDDNILANEYTFTESGKRFG